MTTITDDYMLEMLSTAKDYTIVILKTGPKAGTIGAADIILEHARNNFALRAEGKLSIVFAVTEGSDLAGVGIFNLSPEEVKLIMDEDPGVKAGVFFYEIHRGRSFPGDSLPK